MKKNTVGGISVLEDCQNTLNAMKSQGVIMDNTFISDFYGVSCRGADIIEILTSQGVKIYVTELVINEEAKRGPYKEEEREMIKKRVVVVEDICNRGKVGRLSDVDINLREVAKRGGYVCLTSDQRLKKSLEENEIRVVRSLRVVLIIRSIKIIFKEEALKIAEKIYKNDKRSRDHKPEQNYLEDFKKELEVLEKELE